MKYIAGCALSLAIGCSMFEAGPNTYEPGGYEPYAGQGGGTSYVPANSGSGGSRSAASGGSGGSGESRVIPVADNCAHRSTFTSTLSGSATPFQLVDLEDLGYCLGDAVGIQLESDVQSLRFRAVSSLPVQFVMPVWVDLATGLTVGAEIRAAVVGADGTHALGGSFRLAALQPSTEAEVLGETTLLMIDSVREALGDSRSNLGRFSGDRAAVDAKLARSESGLDSLAAAVRRLQSSAAAVVPLTLASGIALQLNRESLAYLDAFFLAFLESMRAPSSDETASAGTGFRLLQDLPGELGDPRWLVNGVDDLFGGSAAPMRRLVGSLGVTLFLLRTVGPRLAIGASLAPLSAAAFAGAVLAPAAIAFTLQTGVRLLTQGPARDEVGDTWRDDGIQADIGDTMEVFEPTLREPVLAPEQPAAEAAAAVQDLYEDALGEDGVVAKVGDTLWKPQESCPDGVLPSEISFKPYSVKCPEAECPLGILPSEISYNPYSVKCPEPPECPGGALPVEISYKPYSVKCPEAECADGQLPVEISYNPYSVTCPPPRTPSVPSTDDPVVNPVPTVTPPNTAPPGSNVCFVGAGVAVNPTEYAGYCAAATSDLRVPRTRFLDCLDANPSLRVPAPVLPDGSAPSSKCTQLYNADLGPGASGCEEGLSCWCCP